MSEIVSAITPKTVGIIWLPKDERDSSQPHYAEIDYLVDGLLTANLKVQEARTSRLIVAENFNRSLLVLVISEIKSSEIESFVTLVKKDMADDSDILIIDEKNAYKEVENYLREFASKLRVIH